MKFAKTDRNLKKMEQKFTYNQAVFGLMLLGAKADGRLQDEEKKLLVELTSEEHHLTADEYKFVISEAKVCTDEEFSTAVYQSLENQTQADKVKALYWLLQLMKADASSNNTLDNSHNERELTVYQKALAQLKVKNEDVEEYERTRNY
jgi:uncharacterized tellurite resistance protein B-like protein